jgi:hypothetical protein
VDDHKSLGCSQVKLCISAESRDQPVTALVVDPWSISHVSFHVGAEFRLAAMCYGLAHENLYKDGMVS